MINNRQNGRRRGRGGGPRTPNVSSGAGNRQDSRQRGNATQLLDKYKALARDAQMAGDRVQTEYYFQFAEHYFRILNETRVRMEESRRQRGDFTDDDEDQDEGMDAEGGDYDDYREAPRQQQGRERQDRGDREERGERQDRGERNVRSDRDDRGERNVRSDRDDRAEREPQRAEREPRRERSFRDERPRDDRPREERPRAERPREEQAAAEQPAEGEQAAERRPRRPRRVREEGEVREVVGQVGQVEERIALDALPPAIGADPEAAPRRRAPRRPRPENDTDIAPAA